MAYKFAKEITPEMALRAKKLAFELKEAMEARFLERVEIVKSELEEMGFLVCTECSAGSASAKRVVHVTLHVLKERSVFS